MVLATLGESATWLCWDWDPLLWQPHVPSVSKPGYPSIWGLWFSFHPRYSTQERLTVSCCSPMGQPQVPHLPTLLRFDCRVSLEKRVGDRGEVSMCCCVVRCALWICCGLPAFISAFSLFRCAHRTIPAAVAAMAPRRPRRPINRCSGFNETMAVWL